MATGGMLSQYLGMLQAGMAPEDIQKMIQEQKAMQFAQMTPSQQQSYAFNKGIGSGVQSLMRGLGVQTEDPVMKQASMLRQIQQRFDTNTPEGLMQYANALREQGMTDMAQQAMMAAQDMAVKRQQLLKERAATQKTEAEATKAEQVSAREEQLRSELAALPADATDADVERVVRKYGKPDEIFKTLERKQAKQADIEAKAQLAREKAERDAAEKQRDREFKQALATASAASRSAVTDVQKQLAQARLDELKAKQQDKTEKAEANKQAAVAHATKVLGDVTAADGLVSARTTGLVGKGASLVPGTDAFNLNQRLLTIKANLGFDRLQQMRDASPTGGALGQVAVQELNALQATIGSLELGQDKDELRNNLNKIEHHYSNWIRTVNGEKPLSFEEFMRMKNPQAAASTGAVGGWSIRPKGQ